MSKQENKDFNPNLRFPEFIGKNSWKIQPLGEAFSNRQDKGFPDLPLLSLTDKKGLIPQAETNRKDNSKSDKSKYLRVCVGDVAYNTMRMWEGRSAYVDLEGLVSPAYTVCQPKSDNDGLFYSYYFKTDYLIQKFRQYSQGLVNDTLSLKYDAFSKIKAPILTDLIEQKKIANCFLSVDSLIEVQSKKVEDLKLYYQGLLQQLFPKVDENEPEIRFPEFKENKLWKKKYFSELFEIGGGKDHKHLSDGNIPIYGSGGYMRSGNEYLYDGQSACIGRKGTINKPIFLTGKFWTVDTLFFTHSFKNCLPKFIFLLFKRIDWLALNEAGGVPSLSKVIINKVEVMLPEIAEQQKIVDFFSSIEVLIKTNEKKLETLKFHKTGIMQLLYPNDEVCV